MSKKILTAGIDIGGTKIQAVILEKGFRVTGRGRRLSGNEKPDLTQADLLESVMGALRAACSKAGKNIKELAAIGVGCAGQVEARTGDVLDPPNFKWDRIPVRSMIERSTEKPVTIVNDVQAAAWGEFSLGAGGGATNMVCIFVGTGIGSGIIINGELYRGSAGCAGEVGHTHFKTNGAPCQCGQKGCAEAYAGGRNLCLRAGRAIRRGTKSRITDLVDGNLDHIPANVIYKAAKEGDPLAKRLWRDAELAIGAVCHNYVDLLNPDILVLGGGILDGIPQLRDFARSYVKKRAVPTAVKAVKIVAPKLGKLSAAVGAAELAYRNVLNDNR